MSRGGAGAWGVGMSRGEGIEAWEVCQGVGPGGYVQGVLGVSPYHDTYPMMHVMYLFPRGQND